MRQPYRVITRRRTRHLQKSRGPFQDPCNALVSHRVFCSLNGTSPDDFPRRFGLEHHRLFGEGISSFRLIVTGNIGVKEIERLIKKLELEKEILADQDDEEKKGIFE